MQKYYFNFFDGHRWLSDSVGQDFENLLEAEIEAKFALISVSINYLSNKDSCVLCYDIADEVGKRICRVKMSFEKEFFTF